MDERNDEFSFSAQSSRLRELLIASQSGDAKSYRTFLMEVAAFLRPFLKKNTKHNGVEEDILQDTLISIHRSLHTYDPSRPLSAWVFAIARYRLIDFKRKEQREFKRMEKVFYENSSVEEQSHADSILLSHALVSYLDKLPNTQRQSIEYTKIKGFSVRETAEKMEMTESAVKVAVFRGMRSLKKISESEDV